MCNQKEKTAQIRVALSRTRHANAEKIKKKKKKGTSPYVSNDEKVIIFNPQLLLSSLCPQLFRTIINKLGRLIKYESNYQSPISSF